jgi:MFS family permease
MVPCHAQHLAHDQPVERPAGAAGRRLHGRPGLLIVNVALPSIATDLGAGESSLEWVVAGYGLTFTERFGRAVVAAGGTSLTAGLALMAFVVAEIGTGGSLLALVAAVVLTGVGIGLCFTPLTSTVLANVDPARAGSASGAMSTTQQIGYALGVAITGVIYFGAASDGIAHAFEVSLVQLAVIAAGVVVASRLLPGGAGGTAAAPALATAP